jgi:hypothetical protein
MFGRAPMSQPFMGQPFPMEAYPQQQFLPPPGWVPEGGMARPPAAPPANGLVRQPSPPAPRFRAQSPDEPAAPRAAAPAPRRIVALSMPSPETLGVPAARPAARPAADVPVDWSAAMARLDRLGATCFQVERLPQGGSQFTCLLPTGQANQAHRIEARAGSEGEAVRLALDRAEAWASGR